MDETARGDDSSCTSSCLNVKNDASWIRRLSVRHDKQCGAEGKQIIEIPISRSRSCPCDLVKNNIVAGDKNHIIDGEKKQDGKRTKSKYSSSTGMQAGKESKWVKRWSMDDHSANSGSYVPSAAALAIMGKSSLNDGIFPGFRMNVSWK